MKVASAKRRNMILAGSLIALGLAGAALFALSFLNNREVLTETVIGASDERVWAILADFDSYAEWNPSTRISGNLTVGEVLALRMQQQGQPPVEYAITLLKVDENRELRWVGKTGIDGLFDVERWFVIERMGEDQVRFTQGEKFRGLLTPLAPESLYSDVEKNFENFNQVLKEKAEASSPATR
jgi:hypothetical protein